MQFDTMPGARDYERTFIGELHLEPEYLPLVREIRDRFLEKRKTLTDEIREFIAITDSNFSITDVNKYLGFTTKDNIKTLNTLLWRLAKEGVIERAGTVMVSTAV